MFCSKIGHLRVKTIMHADRDEYSRNSPFDINMYILIFVLKTLEFSFQDKFRFPPVDL